MTSSQKSKSSRRDFLKLAGVGTVGAASIAAAVTPASAEETVNAKTSGYQETQHVKTYYDLARF